MGDVLIGVDLGTTGTKTAVFTARGEPVADAFAATPLRWYDPGHVDQDPDDFYHATTRTIGGCLAQARVAPERVAAIGIAGQMAGVLGVDEAWQPSMPYDSWLDQRCSPDVRACGIRGTDLRIVAGAHRHYPPGAERIPGHEIAGVIVARGGGVDLPEGAPAYVAPIVGCGRCPQYRSGRVKLCVQPQALGITRDGAFAEYVLLPADLIAQGNVLPVSTQVDYGHVLCFEAGGAGVAITVHLLSRPAAADRPARIVVTNRGADQLVHVRALREQLDADVAVAYVQNGDPRGQRRARGRAAAWIGGHQRDRHGQGYPGLTCYRRRGGRIRPPATADES